MKFEQVVKQSNGADMDGTMTWDQVVAELQISNLGWNDQVRAVAAAFGSGEDEPFIDWLINGDVSGADTIDQIYRDWEANDE